MGGSIFARPLFIFLRRVPQSQCTTALRKRFDEAETSSRFSCDFQSPNSTAPYKHTNVVRFRFRRNSLEKIRKTKEKDKNFHTQNTTKRGNASGSCGKQAQFHSDIGVINCYTAEPEPLVANVTGYLRSGTGDPRTDRTLAVQRPCIFHFSSALVRCLLWRHSRRFLANYRKDKVCEKGEAFSRPRGPLRQ